MRFLWMIGGSISLGIGVVGIILPLLPTTPFVILAAYCYARSSKHMHDWLLTHRVFGPLINDWRRQGAIRRPAKILATVSIAAVFIISLLLGVATSVLLIQAAVLLAVLAFIWTRPDGDGGKEAGPSRP
ncbi:MAG: YbaN family protein [Pseudomonadota bacterium]